MAERNRHLFAATLLLAAFAAVAGCGRSNTNATTTTTDQTAQVPAADVRVTEIAVGKGIQADKRIATPATTFGPDDTIYASVVTDGASPGATLTAKWTFEDGQVVEETTQTIAPSGQAVTEFHVSKPSGWPAGAYTVEILLNGTSAGRRDFQVRG